MNWIKMQSNGVAVICAEHEAQGVIILGENKWGAEAIAAAKRPDETDNALMEIADISAELAPPLARGLDVMTATTSGTSLTGFSSARGMATIYARAVKDGRRDISDVPDRWRGAVQEIIDGGEVGDGNLKTG